MQTASANIPNHVAIIMDGNGRWAKQRGFPRIEGHRAGAESARVIIRTAGELGIKYLTLYAFSVENWNRPKEEVDALMKYLVHYLKTETPELNKNNVRLEILRHMTELLLAEDKVDRAARQKIRSQKREVPEGSEEWDLLHRRYYSEELKKLGIDLAR